MKATQKNNAKIVVYPFEKLGHAEHGWLSTRHHFSFASYRDMKRVQFGALRVINDDTIIGGEGFDSHPHKDMEIITYVRKGAISHRDSMGNEGRTGAGDVQVMSAGKGVFHSEYNSDENDTVLYQIWIIPNELGVAPRWRAQQFPKDPVTDGLKLLVSGRAEDAGKGALFIHQDAAIYGGKVTAGTVINHAIKYQAYILASEGEFFIDDQLIKKGDGAEVTGTHAITLKAKTDAEILVIDVPPM